MGRTGRAQPDTPRHQRLRMTGTEPHAPRGTAGRGSNRDHGPRAGRGSYASAHAHLGTAGSGTRKGTVGCERAGRAA
jgi:hypothetical protein